MKKFVIITDSCSDLNKELRDKYEIDYIPMRLIYEDKDIPANLDWEEISFEDFYNMMRKGVRFKTAQINTNEYEAVFEKYIQQGCDILSISCSSAFSNSYKCSTMAAEALKAKYPDFNILCVDSLNACSGLGSLCITAAKLRDEGKTILETYEYIENNKLKMNQFCTVESLTYLKRAGRVSATSAVFGGLLQIKPIIISDAKGQNAAVEKVKGRKNSFNRIVEMFAQAYEQHPYQRVVVAHADCYDDILTLKQMVEEKLADKSVEVEVQKIGPIIGSTTGPGAVVIYCYGKEVTFAA